MNEASVLFRNIHVLATRTKVINGYFVAADGEKLLNVSC